jgi:hypothetical protein
MFPELIASQVVLTNSNEVHGPVVAEHVIALIFCAGEEDPAGCVAAAAKGLGTGVHLE